MLGRFKKFAEQASEFLAPTQRTDKEILASAWLSVRQFFEKVPRSAADSDRDDPLAQGGALARSPIPDCLAEMLDVLQREQSAEGETGPCLEYLISEKCLDQLCALGQVDRPLGMTSLCLHFLTAFVTELRPQLLEMNSVREPVVQLLAAFGNDLEGARRRYGEDAVADYVRLATGVCRALANDHSMISIFLEEKEKGHGNFPLYEALLPFISLPAAHGDAAREGMLSLLGIGGHVREWVGPGERLCASIADGICDAYGTMPRSVSPEEGAGSAVLLLYDRVRFANAVPTFGGSRVGRTMGRAFGQRFLERVVRPGIESQNESEARAATWYARGVVRQLDSPEIVSAAVSFLLGEEGPLSHMGSLLVERLGSPDKALALATLQLFDALLALHDKRVMGVLVVEALVEGRHLARGAVEDEAETQSEGDDTPSTPKAEQQRPVSGANKGVDSFLALSPTRRSTVESIAEEESNAADPNDPLLPTYFSSYLADAEVQTSLTLDAAGTWDIMDAGHGHGAIAAGDLMAGMEEDEDAWNNRQAAGGGGGGRGGSESPYEEPPFLTAVFDLLTTLPDLPLPMNLILTGILAQLARSPHPAVDGLMLDAGLKVREGVRTLPTVLAAVATEAGRRGERIEGFADLVARERENILKGGEEDDHGSHLVVMDDDDGDADSAATRTFLRAVVVLEEFCKELAAVVATKQSLGRYESQMLKFPPQGSSRAAGKVKKDRSSGRKESKKSKESVESLESKGSVESVESKAPEESVESKAPEEPSSIDAAGIEVAAAEGNATAGDGDNSNDNANDNGNDNNDSNDKGAGEASLIDMGDSTNSATTVETAPVDAVPTAQEPQESLI